MNVKTSTKKLSYAYATSDLAKRLGQSKTGAWYITSQYPHPWAKYLNKEVLNGVYASKFEALAAFQKLPGEIAPYSFTIESDVFNPTTED